MNFKHFLWSISLRLALLMSAIFGLVAALAAPGYHSASLVLMLVIAVMTVSLYRFVSATNLELSRFLDAVKFEDFGQQFNSPNAGAGFDQLGQALARIMDQYKVERQARESELKHIKAVVEHVPVPLISLVEDGSVTLWNNAARRLFGPVRATKTGDLANFGQDFQNAVDRVQPGERILADFTLDSGPRQLMLAATQVATKDQIEKMVSLQDIQSELDGVQLAAWQDLVHVLTHEIMNSITPIASLAKTASELSRMVKETTDRQDPNTDALDDIQEAVSIVAKRSDGLMNFVQSYRQLTRIASPNKKPFDVTLMLSDLARLVEGDISTKHLSLKIANQSAPVMVTADREMVEQILINLIKNAAQAMGDQTDQSYLGAIYVQTRTGSRGQVMIDVADTGPGIDPEIAPKIFVPFFTTKASGSGVGLALSRQLMIAQGGTVRFANRANFDGHLDMPDCDTGAVFTLVF